MQLEQGCVYTALILNRAEVSGFVFKEADSYTLELKVQRII